MGGHLHFGARRTEEGKGRIEFAHGGDNGVRELRIRRGGVVQRTVRLHIANAITGRAGEGFQTAELVERLIPEFLRGDRHGATAETGQIAVADVRADAYPLLDGQCAGAAHDRRVPGVEPAGDVRAGDHVQHGGVITHVIGAEALTQVAVQVDGHAPIVVALALAHNNPTGLLVTRVTSDTLVMSAPASRLETIMATYFDPKSWSPLRAVDLGMDLGKRLFDQGWVDQWTSFTTAWLDPVADFGAGAVTALMPDVLMTLLSEGILSRFGGQEIHAALLGHDVTATLHTLKVRRRGAHFQTKTVVTGVHWDRHRVEELTVIAHGVRLVPGVPTRVRAAQLDVTGVISRAALLGWVNTWQPDWELEPAADGLVLARHKRRRVRALVDAEITDNLLTITVHSAHWRGVRAPRRLTTLQPIPLSGLPNHARISSTHRVGDYVCFAADLPGLTGSFDLAQIRSAIVAGTTLIVF